MDTLVDQLVTAHISPTLAEIQSWATISQQSPQWYIERKRCITSSDFACIVPKIPEYCDFYVKMYDLASIWKYNENSTCYSGATSVKKNYISWLRGKSPTSLKVDNNEENNYYAGAALHGINSEKIISNLLSQLMQVEIVDGNFYKSKIHDRLATSPDGLMQLPNESMPRTVELKTLVSRSIDDPIPLFYILQGCHASAVSLVQQCAYLEAQVLLRDAAEWTKEAKIADGIVATFPHLEQAKFDDLKGTGHEYGLYIVNTDKVTQKRTNIYPSSTVKTSDEFLRWRDKLLCTRTNDTFQEVVYYQITDARYLDIRNEVDNVPFMQRYLKPISKIIMDLDRYDSSQEGLNEYLTLTKLKSPQKRKIESSNFLLKRYV